MDSGRRRLFCLFLLLPFAAHAQSLRPAIPFTTDATGSYAGDLYLPAASVTPAPVILLIHGGAWRSGHRSQMSRLGNDFAAHGYASFAIDYDKHPRSFPWSWQEARAAVEFLRAHAAEYHLDPARIAVLGTSAGGQIAALVALAPQGPAHPLGGASRADVPVAAAVELNSIYDMHARSYLIRRYLGGGCETIPQVCDEASPNQYVRPGAPPFFVGHGTHDHIIPYPEATTFIATLHAAGDAVTPYIAKNAGHSYWEKSSQYAPNFAAMLAFLNRTLGPAASQ